MVTLNRVVGSTTGTDVEYVELSGVAGGPLAGLSLIVVESDSGATTGRIDFRLDFDADAALGENGFFLIGNASVARDADEGGYGVTPDIEVPVNFIENSSYTIALVETSTITGDYVNGETVLDAVGVSDGGASDIFFFDAPVVGPDGSFLPAGFIREGEDFRFADFNIDAEADAPRNSTTPVATDDTAEAEINEYVTVDVLGNDIGAGDLFISEIDGQAVGRRPVFVITEDGEKAALVRVQGDGSLMVKLYEGHDKVEFTYKVSDGETESEAATVTVEVPDDEEGVFTLNLLHFADQEAGSAAVFDAPRFSAVLNALRDEDVDADATLTLSSGDAIIPGLFYDASAAVFGSAGIADIQIQNELGVQAIAFGNHEFDFGTEVLAGLISGEATGDFSALEGSSLEGLDFTGTALPYLSTNLDFSTDANMAPLVVEGGQSPIANAITSSTVIDEGGELFGIVGATTPTLGSISSPGTVGISPDWAGTVPTAEELDALAAEIQAEVDALLAANPTMNKVILLAHMQQISVEQELAARLTDVDIIVAGGSNTRLMDANDRLRDGDSAQGEYPIFIENAGGTTTAVVNTDGSYKYVGRLVVDFDSDGNIIADSYDAEISGAYATDAQGVEDLDAEGLIDPEIQDIADAIQAQILETEGNVFGVSNVFLNGNRSGTDAADNTDGVRTQETNLGNLTADANLAYANAMYGDGDDVWFSIKNGGGIRASIGQTLVPYGGTEAVRTVNEAIYDADGNEVKPEGGISQNDIQTTLAFNNNLVVGELTAAEIVALLEHGVDAYPSAAGQFPQIGGLAFSFDADDPDGDGLKIEDAAFIDEDGNIRAFLVQDGVIQNPEQTYKVVTLGFLATGGDSYPFPEDWSVTALDNLNGDGIVDGATTGGATFAADGTEQDAFAEYLLANYGTADTAYDIEDTGRDTDQRIINLDYNSDSWLDGDTSASDPLFFSEIVEGSSFNKAVEIYNSSDEDIDLAAEGYVLKIFFNGSTTAGATIALDGVIAAGGTFVIADDGAAAAILAVADQTSTSNFFNGDDAIALMKGDDYVDVFGQIGTDPGSEWAGGGQNDTLRRVETVTEGDSDPTDAFDASDEWESFEQDDFSDLGSYGAAETQPLLINEVLGSTTGNDSEYIELIGEAGASLAGLSLIQVGGDAGDDVGEIDFRYDFASDDVLGENGFLLLGNAIAAATYGVEPNILIDSNSLENSSYTLALVETASLGDGDMATGAETVIDAVAVTDADSDDVFFYDAPVVGPDGSYLPAGAGRIADGVDTGTAADWQILNFNNDSPNDPTPGEFDDVVDPGDGSIDDEATLISAIQGTEDLNAMDGQTVVIEAVVTGDFQDGDSDDFRNLSGFFVMEEGADRDGDAATSEGLFVYEAGSMLTDVAEGDLVRVLGKVDERYGKTVIVATEIQVATADAVTDLEGFAETMALPDAEDREAVESMLITIDEDLTFTESFEYEVYGEMTLATDGEVMNFTQVNDPSVEGYAAHLEEIADRTIVLDDGNNVTRSNGDPILQPDGDAFDVGDGIRMGQTVETLTAIMDYDYSAYRLRLPGFEEFETETESNPRPEEPDDVGGSLVVASYNVLNYFTTLGSRGAESLEELARQTDKLVSGITALDADIIGLIEIENNGTAVAELVAAINSVSGTRVYDYVDTGIVGSDEITCGFIYDTQTVELVGDYAVLDDASFLDPLGTGFDRNRPAIAQSFHEIATDGEFTAVINHLKSKGSLTGASADNDQGDGAGNNNATRTEAAKELADWLATDPTGSGDSDVLILGDLNSYAKEDPIQALEDAGYTNAVALYESLETNSYRYSGEIGTLDYGLANASLLEQMSGATVWQVNADEMFIFDYNTDGTYTDTLRPTDQHLFDGDLAAKSSDHDPVVIGLNLDSDADEELAPAWLADSFLDSAADNFFIA